ncbi:MAG: alpha/beta hydrolase [Bacteroidales bacterium]|nr:alpha/beta hydrolase [Bacteroidales bacterium]
MTSFKAQLISALLRNQHLLAGKLKKERFDFNTSIPAFRERCEKGAARFGKLPEGIHVEEEMLAGMQAEWLRPGNADATKLIFYVHGGGYVSGSCNDHRGIVSKIAMKTGLPLLHYEYRLAPEFPYPHAVNDSLNVYQEVLRKGFAPENIVVMGESAGGGLALALLLALKQNQLPQPAAAVAISPWTDLALTGDSYHTANRRSVAPQDSWVVFSKYYAGDHDPRDPLISPLYGDLHGLPPIFINSGKDDELFDDGRRFYEKAKAAGVDISFRAGEGMVHCYPLMAPMFREATEALEEIAEFITERE